MLKMKKILGILLALCFVLSVTAGAASAYDKDKNFGDKDKDKNFGHDGKDKKYDDHKKFKKVWIRGHFETKIVKKVVFKHGHRIVIKKVIKIFIPGHWEFIKVNNWNNHGNWNNNYRR
jgi:Ni/Co efflux regulator RcnB